MAEKSKTSDFTSDTDSDETQPLLSATPRTLKIELKDPATESELSTDNLDDTLVPNHDKYTPIDELSWKDKIKYLSRPSMCQDCQRVRKTNFGERIDALLEPLYCSGCEVEHPQILFTHEDRYLNKDKDRRCMAWRGKISICPHLSLTWSELLEIETTLNESPWDKVCENAGCEDFVGIEISKEPEGALECSFGWLHAFEAVNQKSGFTTQVMEFLRAKHRSDKRAFCPHIQVDPFRLNRPDLFEEDLFNGQPTESVRCLACPATVYFQEDCQVFKEMIVPILISSQDFIVESTKSIDLCWAALMDDESTGPSTDMALKNITWCKDMNCITSKEQMVHSFIIRNADKLQKWKNNSPSATFEPYLIRRLDRYPARERKANLSYTVAGRRESFWESLRNWVPSFR